MLPFKKQPWEGTIHWKKNYLRWWIQSHLKPRTLSMPHPKISTITDRMPNTKFFVGIWRQSDKEERLKPELHAFTVKWLDLLIILACTEWFPVLENFRIQRKSLHFLLSSIPTYTLYSLLFHNQRARKVVCHTVLSIFLRRIWVGIWT